MLSIVTDSPSTAWLLSAGAALVSAEMIKVRITADAIASGAREIPHSQRVVATVYSMKDSSISTAEEPYRP